MPSAQSSRNNRGPRHLRAGADRQGALRQFSTGSRWIRARVLPGSAASLGHLQGASEPGPHYSTVRLRSSGVVAATRRSSSLRIKSWASANHSKRARPCLDPAPAVAAAPRAETFRRHARSGSSRSSKTHNAIICSTAAARTGLRAPTRRAPRAGPRTGPHPHHRLRTGLNRRVGRGRVSASASTESGLNQCEGSFVSASTISELCSFDERVP